jgi:spore germination protein GerM
VSTPVTVEKVLQKLFTPPTRAEAEGLGLRTAISPETTILGAPVDDRIVTVDTSKNFAFGTTTEQIIAYAQVVFTALDIEGVTGVQFAQNGRRIPVRAGDGSSTSQALGRASFPELIPR